MTSWGREVGHISDSNHDIMGQGSGPYLSYHDIMGQGSGPYLSYHDIMGQGSGPYLSYHDVMGQGSGPYLRLGSQNPTCWCYKSRFP